MKRKTKKPVRAPEPFKSVRMQPDAYERLTKIVEKIAQNGWKAVGVDRTDRPTMTFVVSEALVLLEKKLAG